MSKRPRNRSRAVIIHTIGVFVLLLLWLLVIVFKSSLGSLKIPVLIGMILLTIVGLYLLTKILMKDYS